MNLCSYGCGREAKYQFKNGKYCCENFYSKCPVYRKKVGDFHRGKTISDEQKKKLSIAFSGEKNPFYRKKVSKNVRKKMKKAMSGENNPNWKGGYNRDHIPYYDTYAEKISFAEEVRRNFKDKNIMEVKCTYCGKWFIPDLLEVGERIRCLNGSGSGECRFYCSEKCKKECSIYRQVSNYKGQKRDLAREVQPELRQMRFEIDNYTCQRCDKYQDELEVGLHCHHLEGILYEPLESADVDKVITVCKTCHKEIHKKEGCTYYEMRCK